MLILNTLEKIISVQPFTNNVDVYTFDTETADSYIAEGVVVYDAPPVSTDTD